jgi:hypothetical protein
VGDAMNYEEKMRMLKNAKPDKKDVLLTRLMRGEKVDITQDADLFYQVNKDRVSLDEFTQRDKFKQEAENVRIQRQNLFDTHHGQTRGKKMRWLGDIPAEIYFSRKEFSPMLSREERTANIRKFLNTYPQFKAGDKRL